MEAFLGPFTRLHSTPREMCHSSVSCSKRGDGSKDKEHGRGTCPAWFGGRGGAESGPGTGGELGVRYLLLALCLEADS